MSEPQSYDFRRPLTLGRDTARRLEMGFERFARMWATQLSSRLREPCSVVHDGLSLRTYDDYVSTLPNPTVLVLCQVDATRQAGMAQFPIPCALVWVDYMFGGSGLGDERERELTDIELVVVRDLMQRALDDLSYSFSSLVPLAVTVRSVQYNPQFVQATSAADPVIVASFTLAVGQRSDTATLMMPADLMLVEPTSDDMDADRAADLARTRRVARERLEHLVQSVPVDVAVQFAPVVVHPRDVVGLCVGDVLPLEHPATRPLDVVVDGVVLAHAAAGSHGSRLACQIVSVEECLS
ncbi:MAG: flagellar motor switch protein FliM [Micrococcales bacterium]|nr:flagellar motor switch protein FliM [Micrococcales bacterium]MCL2668392.1 flagellar motor switch protein FliM [Micrococcales bacterium]